MGKKNNDILNHNEKSEIIADVKEAINKARGSKSAKKTTFSKKTICITIFIVLLIAISFIYWFLANNPKTIFTRSVDVTFDIFKANINAPKYDITKGKIDFKIKRSDGDYAYLNNYDFDINYLFDSLNNNSKNNIKINYDDSLLLDLDLLYSDNKVYINSPSFIDRYIELNKTPINYDSKSINTMLNSLNTAINEAVNGQKVTGSRISLTINNKNMYAYKSSLQLNKENLDIVLDKINKSLLNDERFISSYKSLIGNNYNDVFVNSIIDKIKSRNINNFVVNLYTDGIEHEFIKIELLLDNDVISITNTGKNKYNYLFDLDSTGFKYEGEIKIKEKNDSILVKVLHKATNGGNISNLDFDMIVTQKQGKNINYEDISNSVKVEQLSQEEISTIESKINSNVFLKKYVNVFN